MQYFSIEQQIDHFKGLTYLVAPHKVHVASRDVMLTPSQFNVAFGGHNFAMDLTNERVSRKAWDAFVMNSAIIKPISYGAPIANAMPQIRKLPPFVTYTQLPALFEGITFNLKDMVAVLPNGVAVDRTRFNAIFGGLAFALDDRCEKVTWKAWEAFITRMAGEVCDYSAFKR